MSIGIGPITISAGVQQSIDVGSRTQTSVVVLYNESQNLLQVSGGHYNGYQIPAWTGDKLDFSADSSFSGSLTITPIDISNASSPPSSVVAGNRYAPGDTVPGTYPVPLVRQTTNGGGSMSSASTLSNTGNADGTQVIYVQSSTESTGATAFILDAGGKLLDGVAGYTGVYQTVFGILPYNDAANPFSGLLPVVEVLNAILYINDPTYDQKIVIDSPNAGFASIVFRQALNAGVGLEYKWKVDPTVSPAHAFEVEQESYGGHPALSLFLIDGNGVPHVSSPPVLNTGNQETGFFNLRVMATAGGQSYSYGVNFKTVMTNVPSSVSLSFTTQANCTGFIGTITKYGFTVAATSTAAGALQIDGTYTTVGN